MIHRLPKWVWLGGAVLAFCAGIINILAFLSFAKQAATHVTGIFTHLSIDIYTQNISGIQLSSFSLLFFFLGAVVSGFIIKDGQLRLGRRYGLALMIESLLLTASTYAFFRQSLWGEYLACAAAGLQNAMVSTYSGAIIRTTHMTGILTDFGALIGQWASGKKVDYVKAKLLLGVMLAFFWGGLIGAFLYSRIGFMAMLLPASICALSSLVYLWLRKLNYSKNI